MAEMKFHSASPVEEESVSNVTQTPSVEIGTRRFHAGEEYVYCYNAGGASVTVGLGVKFVTAASGYSVAATSLTDVYSPLVGVVKHTAPSSGDYFWAMTRGFTTVSLVTSITKDYCMLALGAAGKFIEASGTTTLGTATVVATALNPAGTTAYAFIRGNA